MTHAFNLTPAQARFVYYFNGLAPVATCLATPLVTYAQLKRKPLKEPERRLLLVQEVARQIVSGTIGLLTYFGGAMLTGRLMQHSAQKSLGQIIGGTAMSFFGYGFIRPLISTELIVRWLQRQTGLEPPAAPAIPTPIAAEKRLQTFMQGVEHRAQFRGWA